MEVRRAVLVCCLDMGRGRNLVGCAMDAVGLGLCRCLGAA